MTHSDGVVRQPDGEPTVAGRKVIGYCLAIMSVAAAVIHFAVAGAHFQQYWLFGVFLLAAAWLQLAWAAAAMASSARWLLWTGAIVNSGVIAVYVLTRTVGDVVGPTPHAVEALGFGDGLCTVLEAGVVAGCCWLLISKNEYRVPRRQLTSAPTVTAAVTAVLLSVALVAGGPDMVMTATAGTGSAAAATHAMHMPRTSGRHMPRMPGMHMSGTTTATIRLVTATPGGDISMPEPNMQMAAGMQMASSATCNAAPTKAQQQAAVSLVNASWRDARKYRSLAFAVAAGYQPITPSGLPVVHYLNFKSYFATLRGGPVLNTAEPQSLVYANTARGAVLVAAMYIAPAGRATPQPGGCLTQWHEHTNLCQTAFGNVVGVVTAATPACPAGSTNRVTSPMMHVWFVPVTGGPTAIDASDAQLVGSAERVRGPANGPA
jgi:hypothetical protein